MLVFNSNTIRGSIAQIVAKQLSEYFDTEIRIGDLKIGLFNRCTLKDIKIFDQKGSELLSAHTISGKIQYSDLLQSKVNLRTLLLLDTKIILYKVEKDAGINIQFILDKLSNKSSNESQDLKLRIGSLIITRGQISYDERWKENTQGVFNPSHISLDSIHSNISLREYSNDSINIRIRSFKGKEQSGLNIKKLAFVIVGNSNKLSINNFELSLPQTKLITPHLATLNGEWYNLQTIIENSEIYGQLTIDRFNTTDILPLLPMVQKYPFSFNGSIDFAYRNNTIETITSINEINDLATAQIQVNTTLTDNQIDSIKVKINQLNIDSTLTNQFYIQNNPNYLNIFKRLGNIAFTGHSLGSLKNKNFTTTLTCNSDFIGNVSINATYSNPVLSTQISANNTNLAYIFNNTQLPSNLDLSFASNSNDLTKTPQNISAQINIHHAQLPEHDLQNVALEIEKNNDYYAIDFVSTDSALLSKFTLNANFKNNQLYKAKLKGDIANINFAELGLKDTVLSGKWNAKFNLDVPVWNHKQKELTFNIDSLNVNRENNYKLNHLQIVANYKQGEESLIKIDSDFLEAYAQGVLNEDFSFTELANALYHHIPAIGSKQIASSNNFNFKINAKRDDFFKDLVLLPISWDGSLQITGDYNTNNKFWEISANVDRIDIKNNTINDFRLYSASDYQHAHLLVQGEKSLMNENVRIEISSDLKNDSLKTNIKWQDYTYSKFTGDLLATSIFNNFNNQLSCETYIKNSQFIINNKTWNINNGNFTINNTSLNIDSLILCSENDNKQDSLQQLAINGEINSNENNSLHLDLKNIDVDYVLDLVNFDDVLFSGYATGTVTISPNSKRPFLSANLLTKNFTFNNAPLGDAQINGEWLNPQEAISVKANIIDSLNNANTQVEGSISPAEKGLDLSIKTKNMNLSFLNMWVRGIVNNIEGRATGTCRLYGPFKYLDLNGKVVSNITTTIPANGVKYYIENANINISEGQFQLTDGNIFDHFNGNGKIQAVLNHKKLKKFSYNLDVDANNLRLYDINKNTEMPFYATANGNGHINLNGAPGHLTLNVDVTPTIGTLFVYTGQENSLYDDNKDYSLIKFRNKSKKFTVAEQTSDTIVLPKQPTTTDMQFNISVNMNPHATLRVIMDQAADSYIDLQGRGILNANFHNKGNFSLHGTYDIEGGTYKLSVENLLKRNFEIQSGSYINFTGNTDNSPINLRAVYKIPSASIADLNISESFSDRNIPVNCILNIKGTPLSPIVNFELDMPTVSDDEKQMVRNLIASEDDLNMQIIHLLSFGRFYTYDYKKAVTEAESQNQSTVMANSFISSTLSSQINEMLTKVIDTNKWNIGTNVSTGTYGWDDMEVEGLLSGRLLNNRLHFNSNFGYHERRYSVTNDANFVGDFDISYLLTPSGTYRVKAYSQNNDRYFTKSSLTTQGVGIQYQRSFNKLHEIFQIFKRNKK